MSSYANPMVTELVTLLTGLGSLKNIETYPTNTFSSGYPSATIVGPEIKSAYDTVTENQRSYIFTIYIYDDVVQQSIQTAFSSLRDIVDSALDAIDQSLNLAGNADFVRPTASAPYTVDNSAGDTVAVATIEVNCEKTATIMS